jgi:class 3 adenylate cyclase/tetratricopeptide (TPR) repeat protein
MAGEGKIRCTKCGAENREGAKFCSECATPFAAKCPRCGAANKPGAKFCDECAASLASPSTINQTAQPVRVAAEQDDASALEGERKTVTALFADIKGSTELEQDLDPEEARAIVDPALKLMIDAVRRYDGYVVQSTGDGIFALFGAPLAHEDHPQRALYAALRMQEELKRYSTRLREAGNAPIEARVGVNTGEVVVRSIKTGKAHTEYTPIGHTANLASRMQVLAPAGSIAVSEITQKLVEGYFALNALGPTRVKGVSEPVNVYEVTGLGLLRTRLQRSASRGFSRFVGRDAEIAQMKRALEQAKAGHGQIVAAMADPGVGKSRLFFEFKAVAQSGCMVLEALSISHGKASAYLPVIDLLHGYFKIASADDCRTRREKITGRALALDRSLEDVLPFLFWLLGLTEGADPIAEMNAEVKKRRTLEAIKRILLRESLNQPLIVTFEDLHWIDDETQTLLNLLADSIATAKVLLLVNYRPEYHHEWGSKTYYTQLRLDPLGMRSAEEMLSATLGDGVELAPLKRLIIEKTEGNPFFMEETVQVLFDEGALVRDGSVKLTKSLSQLKIPPTVQAILASRIDCLPPDQKDLLQTLAVLGREFPLGLIKSVVAKSEDELHRMLSDLQLGEFIYEQPSAGDVEYIFKHALTQDVAAGSMLIERRKLLHEQTAQAIEAIFADRLDDHVDQLAYHYAQSANTSQAIKYHQLVGNQAMRRSANAQAIDHLNASLRLLKTLPETPERDRRELALQIAIGEPLTAALGWAAPEVERTHRRAIELALRVGEPRQLYVAQVGLSACHMMGNQLRKAQELGERILVQAQAADDPVQLLNAHFGLGMYAFWLGEMPSARAHLNESMAIFEDRRRQNLASDSESFAAAVCLTYEAWLLWYIGFPDQARHTVERALSLAHKLAHPFNLANVRNHTARLYQLRGEAPIARENADAAIAISSERGYPYWLFLSMAVRGWALAEAGEEEKGIALLREGLAGMLAIKNTGARAHFSSWLVEEYLRTGRAADGLSWLAEGFWPKDEAHVYVPELYRLKGELLLKQDSSNAIEAEQCLRTAIKMAQEWGIKSPELRAITSLARLLAAQGKRDEARAMLTDIYGWFTEGFDTADLKDAKALLDELVG